MTRIIAGRAKGRRLVVPKTGTRPTSDRVREAMFASVESKLLADGRTWASISVCDLWAGSGAVALEAWSRGAERVLAIDKATSAVDIITSNIKEVGATGVSVIRRSVAAAAQGAPSGGPFDLVFADPPYEVPEQSIRQDLASAHLRGWFAPDAIVIVERAIRSESPFPANVQEVEVRPYGDTALWYGRVPDETGENEVRHEV